MEVLQLSRFGLDVVPDRIQVTVRVADELDMATGRRLHDAVNDLRASGWSAIATAVSCAPLERLRTVSELEHALLRA